VFINLVDNAIKFARDAERRDIVLTVKPDGADRVRFSVRDFGPGLPPAEMKRLFRLFYRPDNELTRATAGTGIGLALVQQLVTAMSGSVDVRNCEPGAEFRITLPVAAEPV
jgi:two-component system phosphate regulon sensor histidine kinase PhoR